MGKHRFTKLVHLRNKSYGIHKELGTVGLVGGQNLEIISLELRPGRVPTHSLDLL